MSKAKQYFPLIEHNYNAGFLDQMYTVVKPMLRIVFPNQTVIGADNLQTDGTNFIISTHLSQYDWLTHQTVAYEAQRKMAISCGDNLNIPVLGNLLRNLGAFIHFRKENKSEVVPEDVRKHLWGDYVRSLVAEGEYDILAFVGKAPGPDGEPKLGRPYNGTFGEFPKGSLGLIKQTVQAAVKPAYVVPSNISYRRVNEDEQIQRLARMKKNKWSSALIYLYDFLHIATGRLFREGSDLAVSYGEPINIQKTSGKDLWRQTNHAAAMMQTVFDTQLMASAIKDEVHYPDDLESRLAQKRDLFAEAGMNVSPVDTSVEEIISGFESQLGVAVKKGVVVRPDLIAYYANQVDSALRTMRNIRD